METSRTAQPGTDASWTGEERLRRGERADFVAPRAQQPRQRLQHAGIVIDQEDGKRGFRHWAAHQHDMAGSEISATAPPASSFAALILPPCASNDGRADRQAKAEAVILGGVERLEQSACFRAGLMPGPRSFTRTSMAPAGVARVQIVISRCAIGVDAIASIAFMTRLSSTCCNCTDRRMLRAGRSARSVSTAIRRLINSLRSSVDRRD